jgi:N-acetyl-alpha-D-glucosaminyl L-malate synthase BshA
LKIGITCYPTIGGSGIVASTLGTLLANRGYEVHFISYNPPYRLPDYHENIYYHEVEISQYPLFKYPPYCLTLATKMVEVIQESELDILHVHYAIPHTISAYLAKEISHRPIPIITTLHGTDITLVGQQKSFFNVVQFALQKSDGITAVSHFLRQQTQDVFKISQDIEVIHNFVDTQQFKPITSKSRRTRFCGKSNFLLIHVSNFRPVKRVEDVLSVFERIQRVLNAHLLLVGEGPDTLKAKELCKQYNIEQKVCFLGNQQQVEALLGIADLFLLTSQFESFGLSALEAISCGVPVLAVKGGGVTEVLEEGVSGYLCNPGDHEEMAQKAIHLLQNPEQLQKMKLQCRQQAIERFNQEVLIENYVRYYQKVIEHSQNNKSPLRSSF